MSTHTPNAGFTPSSLGEPSTSLATTRPVSGAAHTPPQVGEAPGRTFGPYELLEEIDRGGMGVVYKARQPGLDRLVALKMILSGPAAEREEVLRFQREARAAGRLRHANIIAIHDAGTIDGQHYFTMPLARHGSLAVHVKRLGADPRAAVALVEKVARAVQHAHDNGILHRDLKPANILLGEGDEPWVADFGVAKILDADEVLTRTGRGLGTPAYMAPEQSGKHVGTSGPATDVWSLGVILYELLSGRRPFRGRYETVVHKINSDEPRRLSRLRQGIDVNLEAVVLKCLNKDPARRYASAGALADDLARWLHGEPPLVRPEGWPRRAARRAWRHRAAVLAGVALCALTAAAVLLGARPFRRDPEPPPLPWPGEFQAALDRLPPPLPWPREFQARLDRLAEREEIELVGETRGPLWHRWPLEAGRVALVDEPNLPLIVKSVTFTPIELLPEAPRPPYRLEAEVLRRLPVEQGEAGLFFAHDTLAEGERPHHFFCLYGLADRPNAASLTLTRCRFREPGTKLIGSVLTRDPAPPGGPEPWRRLAVAVTADDATLFLDGALVGRVPYPEMIAKTDSLLKVKLPAPVPAVNPRGTPGIYVIGGAASFRCVVVKPLP